MRRWLRRRAHRPLSCRQVGKVLQSYLDGAVDDLTTRRVAHHLEDCRRCGLEVEVYLAIKASLARSEDEIPPDTLDRLRAFGQDLAGGGRHDHGDDLPDSG